jgi:intracellular multiplication protein IcmD
MVLKLKVCNFFLILGRKKVKSNVTSKYKYCYWLGSFVCLAMLALVSQSASAGGLTMGGMASQVYGSFTQITKLVTAGSYLAGLGFSIGAIFKFKMHKDNPTQVPVGTPIALVFIAAALLFLPTILGITGATMFGTAGGTTAGPTGTVFSSGS